MCKHTILILLILLLNLSFWPQRVVHASAHDATVLIYHKFGEERYPTTNIALERFEEQMRFLQENDYHVIPLSDLVAFLHGATEILPDKAVVITIDDGYLSTYTGAWPILKKYGYPCTVFLYMKAIESHYRNFLSWAQIKEMQRAGIDFQPHTYSHHRLGTWDEALSEDEYRAWIRTDFKKGNDLFRKRLGLQPRYIALPYGEYNSMILDEARKIGFEAVLNQDPGSVSASIDPFRIPREPILGREWATMKHFEEVLVRTDLPVTEFSPSIAPFTSTTPDSFCATVKNTEMYRKGSFGIYVSELGWQRAKLQEGRACIENSQTVGRRTNRVAISARQKDTGRMAIHYWLLLNPHSPVPSD